MPGIPPLQPAVAAPSMARGGPLPASAPNEPQAPAIGGVGKQARRRRGQPAGVDQRAMAVQEMLRQAGGGSFPIRPGGVPGVQAPAVGGLPPASHASVASGDAGVDPLRAITTGWF